MFQDILVHGGMTGCNRSGVVIYIESEYREENRRVYLIRERKNSQKDTTDEKVLGKRGSETSRLRSRNVENIVVKSLRKGTSEGKTSKKYTIASSTNKNKGFTIKH